jgi:pyruvate,water dikinase
MLETGRRLDLSTPADAVELTVDELTDLLDPSADVLPSAPDVSAGPRPDRSSAPDVSAGPDDLVRLVRSTAPEVAAARARRRREDSTLDAPPLLGPEFELPPLDALPRPLALIGAAQLAVADHMSELTSDVVRIGDRPYTGRALVVDDPNEAIDLIEPGDVLITTVTAPAWNVVIAQAGALVTTAGGLLSHAAVIARELGIPAIIGVGEATRHIASGAIVTVDPVTATVTVQTTDAAA